MQGYVTNKIKCWVAVVFLSISFMPLNIAWAHESCFNSQKTSAILDKEEIDVVIKYIDLTDPNLKREGIPQIKKDEDNGELKYAVRSVLKNIPWVRKIFIVMPNEKVRYFKNPELISDKIVYIKDKDLLGFDSASSITFEFNFWKLKNFGVSNNFIYMNDDYFIGKPLNKSDFFYEDNGKIVPYIIYAQNVNYGQYDKVVAFYNNLKKEIGDIHPHTGTGFEFRRISSILFLYKLFKKDILVPSENLGYFPHNAMGENLSELKEVYDLVKNNYDYADACLKAIKRDNKALQQQTMYDFYVLNKYNRRINRMRGNYIDLGSVSTANFNYDLFCINTGGNREYLDAEYFKSKIIMNKLFPQVTYYEVPEINDGIYTIKSALNGNKVLDIYAADKNNGANLQLWSKNGTDAQKFKVTYQSDGSYLLEAMCSGKMIDVYGSGKTFGTNIWQYEKNGTYAQKWYIISAGKGYYNIVSACNNLCVDVEGAKVNDGTNISCWEPNGTDAQKFKFEKTY